MSTIRQHAPTHAACSFVVAAAAAARVGHEACINKRACMVFNTKRCKQAVLLPPPSLSSLCLLPHRSHRVLTYHIQTLHTVTCVSSHTDPIECLHTEQ